MAGDQLLDAVEREDLQAARRLLASGANPHTDSWGMSLLEEAIRRRNLAMARLLVKHGANAQELESDGRDRLHRAASGGDDPDLIELLLNLGLDPNASDKHGWTPLHHAAACGHTRVAALLLRVGADRSTRATAGQTPADLAHLNGHPWTIG